MKKMSFVLATVLVSTLSTATFAESHGKSLGAHVHGSIKLEMAVEGKTIELELEGPAESFLGFEYLPMTSKEKTKYSEAESLWKKDLLTKLVVLDSKLGCTFSENSFKQDIDEDETKEAQAKLKKGEKKESGVHSDIEAKAKITCTQDLKGQSVTIGVRKHYPSIKKLVIEMVGNETKTIEAKELETVKL